MIDVRSDTVTRPTKAMREAMACAPVGDDVYGDDPTINSLEEKAARILGKEAAMFTPSGTFANQCAIMTHTHRGDEIILLEDAHILQHEAGAPALLSGVNMRAARSANGKYDLAELKGLFRDEEDIHYPRTGLVCMENAHGSGTVIDLEHMEAVHRLASERGVPVHLDGARLFNAAISLGVDASQIAKHCESVCFCLSKGLMAPVGSLLVGTKEFIDRARRNRKIMGGAMRQAGILAAAGILALDEQIERLAVDHKRARLLAKELSSIPGIRVADDRLDINMVFFSWEDERALEEELLKRGILMNGVEYGEYRIVMHGDIDDEKFTKLIEAIRDVCA